MIRSLTLKLTLAFLLVGLSGSAFMALLIRQRTQTEFDQFVLDNYQQNILDRLVFYYETNDSWEDVAFWYFRSSHAQRMMRRGERPLLFTLLDENQQVVISGPEHFPDERIDSIKREAWLPVVVADETVGYLQFNNLSMEQLPFRPSPETEFLNRLNTAVLLSALAATAVALFLGALLARNLTRPIRQLTTATQIVAQGELGHQVDVTTRDELGNLANSFNQMSADLARINQSRRQMTADIAHDLRTPLSVILGYTEALNDGKLTGSSDMYAVMHKEAQHLQRLIEDLRTLSLADAGELPLFREDTDPAALLTRIAAAHQVQAQEQGLSLLVDVPDGLPQASMDPDRMAQVLGNLVSNALRYTPVGGTITLAAAANEKTLTMTVTDTGSGIPPADLPHIFQRFYRGEKSRQQQENESGLGLAIARSLVLAHEGTIAADSTPGAGTTFTITLPIR